MKKSRELTAQPLPFLVVEKVFIEKPKLFYTPPEDRYSVNTRLKAQFIIKNNGNYPASNIIASCKILVPSDNGTTEYKSASRQVDILSQNETYPEGSTKPSRFIFAGLNGVEVLSAILQKNIKQPIMMSVTVVYKNVLGASFLTGALYEVLMNKPDDESVLSKGQAKAMCSLVEHKEIYDQLKKLERSDARWDELFKELKSTIADEMPGNDTDLMFTRVPNSFIVKAISEERYRKVQEESHFGKRIPIWYNCCVSITPNEANALDNKKVFISKGGIKNEYL